MPTRLAKARFGVSAVAVVFITGVVLFWTLTRDQKHDSFEHPGTSGAGGGPEIKSFANSLPKQGGPPGYVNSAACKECHPKQFDTWWHSYHRQMTQLVNTNTVKANFDGVVMDSGPARFTLHESSNRYWVDIQGIEEIKAAQRTNGPPPAPLRLPVEMMTGSHHFQVFWTPTGHGNQQIGFPFTWLVAEKHWVPRNDAFIRDPDFEPRPEHWNMTCFRCHSTGSRSMLKSNYLTRM
jgi:hypothetical protein